MEGGNRHIPHPRLEESTQQMTNRQELLSGNPTVRHNAHQCRHKESHHTLHGVEIAYLVAHPCTEQIGAHRDEISSPHSKLEEAHPYESEFHRFTKPIFKFNLK